ncbi:UNVERIFIED_CONTAM: hypothetical protein Sangu_2229100 [Sesamum angustifolium]|uniref:Uncharacterized protein n=1 Tax=Sesamum angustifolium TaxID=2727405 RepID=A0AAW2L3K2_9LAMI
MTTTRGVLNGDLADGSNGDMEMRLGKEFNLLEFHALATRVIDDEDDASLAALAASKERWTAKFGCNENTGNGHVEKAALK